MKDDVDAKELHALLKVATPHSLTATQQTSYFYSSCTPPPPPPPPPFNHPHYPFSFFLFKQEVQQKQEDIQVSHQPYLENPKPVTNLPNNYMQHELAILVMQVTP